MILRGANLIPMYGDDNTVQRLTNLAANGANSVRWSLYLDPNVANSCTVASYRAWLDSELNKLSLIVPTFTSLGLYAVIDLHVTPGGNRLWTQKVWQDEFIRTWQQIATCCIMQPNVPLYDLMNEPLPPQHEVWVQLAKKAIAAIHAIEPGKKIALSSKGGSGNALLLLPYIPGITYTFHFYDPFLVTNQGIPLPGFPAFGRIYTPQDANNIRITLQRIRGWQKTRFRNAEFFVGELDCVRWAPGTGAYKWMRDVLHWLNFYGWHWSFLAWEEPAATFWDQAFSTQYCPDGSCATQRTVTDRIDLLKRAFTGNPIL